MGSFIQLASGVRAMYFRFVFLVGYGFLFSWFFFLFSLFFSSHGSILAGGVGWEAFKMKNWDNVFFFSCICSCIDTYFCGP